MALLVGARDGTSPATLLLLLVLYLISATLWIRGQYVESLLDPTGTHARVPKPLSGALLVAGVLMLTLAASRHLGGGWLDRHTGGVALAAMIGAYFGFGMLVADWREVQRGPGNPLAVELLLGSGLLAAVVGAASAGHWSFGPVLIAVSVLLLLPVGLQLASARAIERLTVADSRQRASLGFGGLAVFVLAVATASITTHSMLLAEVLVVLGLVVTAIASSTQADIAGIFVVLAVAGVTPYQAAVPGTFRPGQATDGAPTTGVLVALGDSYMSGEGASVYFRGTDEAAGDQCRRSPTSWAAQAGQQPPFTGVAFLACSGASTYNINDHQVATQPTPAAQRGEPATQLEQYQALQRTRAFTPSLVVLTIGGNDAGFGTIGEMCLAPHSCAARQAMWIDALPQVQAALEHTYDQVSSAFPRTPVLVVGYPDPIADSGDCGQLLLKKDERVFIKEFVKDLDATLRTALHGRPYFSYLDGSSTALGDAHLQLCDPLNEGQPGVNFMSLRSMRGDAEQRLNPQNWIHNSLHPNEKGHQAMLRVFEVWEAKHLAPGVAAPSRTAPAVAPGTAAVAATAHPCSIVSTAPNSCRAQGQAWALQQVGDALLRRGLPIGLLVVAGAWAASVSLFAWRRSCALSGGAAAQGR